MVSVTSVGGAGRACHGEGQTHRADGAAPAPSAHSHGKREEFACLRLPVAPLLPHLRLAARLAAERAEIAADAPTAASGGLRQLNQEHRERFGIGTALIERIVRGEVPSLTLWDADRLACFLGLHVDVIW